MKLAPLVLLLIGCSACGSAQSEPAPTTVEVAAASAAEPPTNPPATVPDTDVAQHGTRLVAASRALGRHPNPESAAADWVRSISTVHAMGANLMDGPRFMGEASTLFVEGACATAFSRHAQAGIQESAAAMITACREAYCEGLTRAEFCTGDPLDVRVVIGLFSAILNRDHGLDVDDDSTRFIAWSLALTAGRRSVEEPVEAIGLTILHHAGSDEGTLTAMVDGSVVTWTPSQPLPEVLRAALERSTVAVATTTYGAQVTLALGRLAELSTRPVQFLYYESEPSASASPDQPDAQPQGSPRWAALVDEGGMGVINLESVRAALIGQHTRLARCQAEHASAHGRMVVRLTVELDGDVVNVVTEDDTTGSTVLRACVVSAVAALPSFHESPEGGSVILAYPLIFEP